MEAQNNNSDNLHYLGSKNNKNSTKIKNIGDLEMGLLSWFKKSKKNVAAASLAAAISAGAMTPDSAQAYQECSGSIANTQIPIIDSICDDNLKNVYLNINKGKYDAAMVELRRETNIHKLRHEPGYYLAISKLPKKVLHDPGNRLKLKITGSDFDELEKKNPALAYFARGIINDFPDKRYSDMRAKMGISMFYQIDIDKNDIDFLNSIGYELEPNWNKNQISHYLGNNILYKLNNNNREKFFEFLDEKVNKFQISEMKLFLQSLAHITATSSKEFRKESLKFQEKYSKKIKYNNNEGFNRFYFANPNIS